MKFLITGGCGFLGTNLALKIIDGKDALTIFDNLSRHGSEENLKLLKRSSIPFIHGDIRNREDVESLIKEVQPDVIFHLAGQVAMTTSITHPYKDFSINTIGTVYLLEAIRQYRPSATLIYSSTNKVYGDLNTATFTEKDLRYTCPDFPSGFNEATALNFQSPYGCSKGAADQYILDYVRIFGIKAAVFRHSSIYGIHQQATFDQGWIGWFCQQALQQKNHPTAPSFTISGDGKQVRDVLFADDAVDAYLKAAQNIENITSQVFNIGGGMKNSLSLLELFLILENRLGIKLRYKKLPWRQSDQRIFVADHQKATNFLGWEPTISSSEGVYKVLDWLEQSSLKLQKA